MVSKRSLVIAAFMSVMAGVAAGGAPGADFRLINYPGAKHSFTNPDADEYAKKFGMPIAYQAEADRLSWAELGAFLADVFK